MRSRRWQRRRDLSALLSGFSACAHAAGVDMTTLVPLVLAFLVSAAVIVAGGTFLARAGDVIAARTKLGGLWVGSVFLAFATSLPEITTDIAAVRIGAPDLAAGDLFGSSMANMVILALIGLMPAGRGVFRKVTLDHALYASLAVIMTCIAAITILMRPTVSLLGIGPGSILLLATYAVGSRVVFLHTTLARESAATIEMSGVAPEAQDRHKQKSAEPSLRRAIVTFAGASIVILAAAPWFARSAQGIAVATGIGSTFIGTWLVGFSTSLPELVTSLAAMRIGAFDLAVGNLFGSNALNMSIFFVLDAVHREGPILTAVSPVHVISALSAIVLMSIALGALVYRAKGKLTFLEPSSAVILVAYVIALALVLMGSGGR
jgi:cation:H+ antiporter